MSVFEVFCDSPTGQASTCDRLLFTINGDPSAPEISWNSSQYERALDVIKAQLRPVYESRMLAGGVPPGDLRRLSAESLNDPADAGRFRRFFDHLGADWTLRPIHFVVVCQCSTNVREIDGQRLLDLVLNPKQHRHIAASLLTIEPAEIEVDAFVGPTARELGQALAEAKRENSRGSMGPRRTPPYGAGSRFDV